MLRHNSAVFFTKWTVHLVWAGIAYLLLVGTSKGAQAGILQGLSHTHWAINRFSVDGRSGLDTIGAWQLGGGGRFQLALVW